MLRAKRFDSAADVWSVDRKVSEYHIYHLFSGDICSHFVDNPLILPSGGFISKAPCPFVSPCY